jgi:hypothetical protein
VFICYAITSGIAYSNDAIGWAIVGDGKLYTAPFLTTAKEKVLKHHPGATFKESWLWVEAGEQRILLLGEEGYGRWVRDGRPEFDLDENGVPTWPAKS